MGPVNWTLRIDPWDIQCLNATRCHAIDRGTCCLDRYGNDANLTVEEVLEAPLGAVYKGVSAFHMSIVIAILGVVGMIVRYFYLRRWRRLYLVPFQDPSADLELSNDFGEDDVTIGGPLSGLSPGGP